MRLVSLVFGLVLFIPLAEASEPAITAYIAAKVGEALEDYAGDVKACSSVPRLDRTKMKLRNFSNTANRCDLWLYIGSSDMQCRCARQILGGKHKDVMRAIESNNYGFDCNKNAYGEPSWFPGRLQSGDSYVNYKSCYDY
jgi:hypothetical protein